MSCASSRFPATHASCAAARMSVPPPRSARSRSSPRAPSARERGGSRRSRRGRRSRGCTSAREADALRGESEQLKKEARKPKAAEGPDFVWEDERGGVRQLGSYIGGGGGGRRTLAEAGGKQPERLREALEAGRDTLVEALS